jgi:hypothetical protein
MTSMMEAPVSRSKFFKFVVDSDAYRETEDKDDAEPFKAEAERVASVDPTERLRKFKGRDIPALVFSIGVLQGFFWMPKDRFYGVTEEKDINKQTNKPFEE